MKQMQKSFIKKNLYLNNLKANLNKWAGIHVTGGESIIVNIEIFYKVSCNFNVVSHKIHVRVIFGHLINSKIHLEEEMC